VLPAADVASYGIGLTGEAFQRLGIDLMPVDTSHCRLVHQMVRTVAIAGGI